MLFNEKVAHGDGKLNTHDTQSREAKQKYISGITLQKPYATTVSKDLDEDYKSESTV